MNQQDVSDAERHQQELEQMAQDPSFIKHQLDLIAYRCLGVAQSMKDLREIGNVDVLLKSEQRLIELATEYETLKGKL